MGLTDRWLERWASTAAGPGPQHIPDAPRALTAAGTRVNLRRPDPAHTKHEQWQYAAWQHRDDVPEMRFAGDFIASSLGRLRVFPAENRPRGEEPVPLEAATQRQQRANGVGVDQHTIDAAIAATERLNLNQHGTSLLSRFGENLEFAGECYLLGERDDEGQEQWSVRSILECQITTGGGRLVDPVSGAQQRELRDDECELMRLWSPDPAFFNKADAPVRGVLKVLREMDLIQQRGIAHAQSRISAGTGLFIPQELMMLTGPAAVSGDLPGVVDDPMASDFMAKLIEYMTLAINNVDDPSAIVPLLLTGPSETQGGQPMKEAIGTFQLHAEDPKGLSERYEALMMRFARGINLAPERVRGIGEATSTWTANTITADEVKVSIEPRAERMCDSLTAAYLRRMLKHMGVSPSQIAKVALWYDASELVQNPNRAQDAKDLFQAGELSGDALRRSAGFTSDDGPTGAERLARALATGELSDTAVTPLISLYNGKIPTVEDFTALDKAKARLEQPAVTPTRTPSTRTDSGPTAASSPKQIDSTPPVGERSQPKTASQPGALGASSGTVTAAAKPAPQWRLERRLGQDLARVDRELVTRILAHADATTGRAVERAAAKIRASQGRQEATSRAPGQRNGGRRDHLFPRGSDPRAVVAAAGRTITDMTDASLFEGALDDLETLWDNEVGHAATAVEALLDAALLPGRAQPTSMVAAGKVTGLADELRQRGKAAWGRLRDRLVEHAGRVLYGEYVPSRGGESSPGITPVAIVRDAVGEVGNGAGLATGEVPLERLRVSGTLVVAHEWQYPMTARNHFLPHRRLDGVVFESWTDPQLKAGPGDEDWIVGGFYHPSDHEGCLCFTASICVVPLSENADDASDEVKALRAQVVQGQ